MSIGRVAVAVLGLSGNVAAGVPARAADAATVEALLGQGYAVVAAIPSAAGPGLFLQKGGSLYACFVAETPNSAELTTRYCKPVR